MSWFLFQCVEWKGMAELKRVAKQAASYTVAAPFSSVTAYIRLLQIIVSSFIKHAVDGISFFPIS